MPEGHRGTAALGWWCQYGISQALPSRAGTSRSAVVLQSCRNPRQPWQSFLRLPWLMRTFAPAACVPARQVPQEHRCELAQGGPTFL